MTLSTASILSLPNTKMLLPPDGPDSNVSDKSKTGTFSDLLHGDGTFTKTISEVNGQKTVDRTLTYADGTTKTKERVITVNPDGSKTITKTGKNGKTSTVNETFVQNADGSTSFTKDKTKANGSVVETQGTITKTDGEKDVQMVRTNAKGQTETLDRQTTHGHHTKTHITTGNGYDGHPIYDESQWTILT